MEQSLQKYYEEQFSMMATQGWADLIEDFRKFESNLNNLSTVADAQQLFFRQGQLDILNLVLQRKEMCEKVYQELEDEKNL